MLTLSDSAAAKLREIVIEENNPKIKLRVFVEGGGCHGLSTGFTLVEEQNEDDWDLDLNGIHILVDSISKEYLEGSLVDYVDDVNGCSFTLTGMSSSSTCGCGSSFSP